MFILLVEDEKDQRELVADILKDNGHSVLETDSVEAAIVELKKLVAINRQPDVVFSDWKLGTLTGIKLLEYVRTQQINCGFVVATAYGSVQHAVEAIAAGADDYLSKPFQTQELLLAVTKANTASQLRLQNSKLSAQLSEQQSLVEIVGSAPCMQKVYERITRVSNTNATVLIHGESGTGKELAARALHQQSQRRDKNFIAINCGAIPESLAEAELFGAEKGAYTGAHERKIGKIEAAQGGTLFLDEIGELPLALQAKLLRFLQESVIVRLGSSNEIKVDTRVIAATHRNIPDLIEHGDFREDLYYRLNVVPLNMPALKERREDIPKLFEYFIKKFEKQYGSDAPPLNTVQKRQIYDYNWPGNVRELSNRVERFVLLGEFEPLVASPSHPEVNPSGSNFKLTETGLNWEEFEKDVLNQALELTGGNKTKAAKLLNLNYKQFLYRLEK